MSEPRRVYCICSGCIERGCNASNAIPCGRNREWSGISNMKALGWRRRKGGRWLCPTCAAGARKQRKPPVPHLRAQNNRVEPAADPVWAERGAELLDYLREPKSWLLLQVWAEQRGYTDQVLRNVIASVHDRVGYCEGTWRAVRPRAGFEPVPPGPPSTLQARLADEIL